MALTSERITALASKKGVKAIAVSNFLRSLGELTERDAFDNLNLDARLYRWNAATVAAIRRGLREHFR